jgi:hypothetical protein
LERSAAWAYVEDGCGARGGDEGGVGDGERSLHLLRAPVMLRIVLPVPDRSRRRAEDGVALETVAARREMKTVARGMGSGCCRCSAREGSCMQAPCARVDQWNKTPFATVGGRCSSAFLFRPERWERTGEYETGQSTVGLASQLDLSKFPFKPDQSTFCGFSACTLRTSPSQRLRALHGLSN